MFPLFPLLNQVIQKLRTNQTGEVILIAPPGGHHNRGFHIYYVCGWTTHPSFHTAETCCHNRDMSRIPSTNRMYDGRWLRFANWATGNGVDPLCPTAAKKAAFLYELFDTRGLSPQTIKGYRFCLATVLSHTGKAAAVQAKTISDMSMSMELQRPRFTSVLPQWDIGIVLEALCSLLMNL